jgi:hypothetical protein
MSDLLRKNRLSSTILDRRTMLGRSVLGGAAVAVGLVAPERVAAAGLVQSTGGVSGAVKAGRMRRVVTGTNDDGKSFIASDEMVATNNLWTTSPDHPLGAGPTGEAVQIDRATGASRCFIAMLPPSGDLMPSLENRIGFHRTPGVAYCLLLTGQVDFLVDVEEVRLQAGDLVVERGTEHSWRNRGSEPVGLLVVGVDGEASA